ncbi:glycosyltransferase family 1 protein [Lichenibacterium minor]|uniref:Glycosyltransferase family 1 protein n=1 Tax=Lichenibacterium minor TaxID=2316528 RepID=A0A4Q2TZW7_9HYPH|nr:glycosyltransferase [Lichenibacterium minor]RYC29562.1 glycosyltransferase family 1 protein [Lichenibacterium minor]
MTADAVGGVWTYALDLGAALARHGDLVTLAVLGPAPSDAQRADAAARGLALSDLGHPPDWLAADAAAVRAGGRALAKLAGRVGADILHLNHPALAAAAPFPVPTLAFAHSCVATWWDAVRGGALPDDFRWRAALHEAGLAAADAVAAPSAAFAEATRRVYGFGAAPLAVPNGRDVPPASADAPPAPSVLTAGRLWDEGKNLAVLDRAAARLPVAVEAAGPLVGPNGARIALHHTVALGTLGAAAMRAKLATRPIFVSSALYEPFGLSVLEAAQAGCALVLSDIPTFRESWGDAALFVPPHDDRALAAAVLRLLGDRADRAERATLSGGRAARYTVGAMADATLKAHAAAVAGFGAR